MKLPNSNSHYLRLEEFNVNLYGVDSFQNLNILLLLFERLSSQTKFPLLDNHVCTAIRDLEAFKTSFMPGNIQFEAFSLRVVMLP